LTISQPAEEALVGMLGDGDDMEDIIDGSYDAPEGRKVFVSRRTGESSEHFAQRAMAMLDGVGYPLGETSEEDQKGAPLDD
jgi:hypothetical protein